MRRVGILGLFLVLLGAFAQPAGAVVKPPGRVLMIGDSLTLESASAFAAQVTKHKGWVPAVHAYGGTAPCEWINWLPTDLALFQPTVVGIATVGNWWPAACMEGITPNSPAYWTKYRSDLATLIEQAKAANVKVVLFAPPPMQDPTRQAISKQMVVELKALAVAHGVKFHGGIRSALGGAVFTTSKPCLATETAAMGCNTGLIAIRTLPPASDAGLHLCTTGLIGTGGVCATYSSGEFRYGRAAANALIAA